jgi:hypothetical protein
MGEDFRMFELAGILLIGSGLALLSLFNWLITRETAV